MCHYTSIEQSKKLLELGLSAESADMEYMFLKKDGSKVSNIPFVKEPNEEPDCCYNFVSCWSVGALIKLLPHDIVYQTKLFEPIHCMLNLSKTGVGYSSSINGYPDTSFNQCWIENPDLVDALYNCMVWLLENNYIKKTE